MCMHMRTCMYTTCMQVVQKIQSSKAPGIGVTSYCESPYGCWSRTHDHYKSSKFFQLLGHFSSSMNVFFFSIQTFVAVPNDIPNHTYNPGYCFWSQITQVLLISLLHCSFFRHTDAIQKLFDILVFNCWAQCIRATKLETSRMPFSSRMTSYFWA